MSDSYQGSWSVNLEKSRVWDAAAERWISPDPIGREDLTFFIDGDIHDYTNTVGLDPTYHLAYTARWDGDWVPYMCRKIEPSTRPEGAGAMPDLKMPRSTFQAGRPIAYVKVIKVNDRVHYRISRSVEGEAQYSFARVMNPDGDSFVTTVIDGVGVVNQIRLFERTSH